MSQAGTESRSASTDDQEIEKLKQLIHRLRPGDTVEYQTSTGHEVTHKVIEISREEGYYRVYAKGPQGGRYLLMPEKPDGMGNHPAPEVFWVNPNPDEGSNPYEVVTRGSITSLSITAEREL